MRMFPPLQVEFAPRRSVYPTVPVLPGPVMVLLAGPERIAPALACTMPPFPFSEPPVHSKVSPSVSVTPWVLAVRVPPVRVNFWMPIA